MTVQRDVAIRYALSYQDKGLARAVTATRELEQASGKAGAAVTLAARRSQDAWRLLDRDARKFDSDTTRRALSQSTAVSRSVQTQIGSLRKLGASYSEIERMMRTYGATVQQTSAAIRQSYDREASAAEAALRREEAALKRAAAARQTLKSIPGSILGVGGGGGISKGEERSFVRGTVRGAVGRGAGLLGGGLLGGLAGFVSVQGIKDAIKGTQELALQTRELHAITGMDAKTSAEWVGITNARGISARSFATSLKTLSTQTEGAMSGTKASVKVFAQLGITQAELKNHSHDLSGMLGLVADHLNKMPGGAEKTAIAGKLLGRNFMALTPILSEGSKGMAEQRKEAAQLADALGVKGAASMKNMEEASVKLKIQQEILSAEFTRYVAPALIKVTSGGIKLAEAVGHELGPAFKALSPVVKDVGHWLGENKGIVLGVVGAFAALKIVRTVGGWFGGLYNDAKKVVGFGRGVVDMFRGQAAAADTDAAAMDRLAASLERVALAQRELGAGGAGGMPGIVPGAAGAPGIAGKGATAAAAEAKLATGAEMTVAEGGIVGGMFGRQGLSNLTSKLGSAASKAGGGLMFGLLGNQLGGMAGGMLGGKKGAGWGTAIGTGAGLGMMFGPEGALLGAGVGAAVHGLQTLTGGSSPSATVAKLQAEMAQAVRRGDWRKLGALGDQAQKTARGLSSYDQAGTAAKLRKLADAADKASNAIGGQQAGRTVQTMLQAQGASRFSSVGAQVQAIVPSLDRLPAQFQDAGALSAIQFASGLERQGRLPRGATDRLIGDLEGKFPALTAYLQQQGGESMGALADQFRVNKVRSSAIGLIGQIHKTFGFLPTYAQTAGDSTQAKMRAAMGSLQHIIKTGTAAQRAAAEPELKKLQGLYGQYMDALKTRTQNDTAAARRAIERLGGNWSSLGSVFKTVADQQIIPSLNGVLNRFNSLLALPPVTAPGVSVSTAPQRGGHFAHGGYVVPGDPTRDGTLILAAGNEVVLTGSGQQQMESYAPGLLDHIVATQAPHFAHGGHVKTKARAKVPGHFGSHTFTGPVSTFGPPGEAAGSTAYGGTDAVPGIAINPGAGQGGWNGALAQSLAHKTFLVSIGGHEAFLQVIDKGPSASGTRGPRMIDVTGTGAMKMGYRVGAGGSGFPTDAIGTAREWVGPTVGGLYTAHSPAAAKTASYTTFAPVSRGLTGDAFDLGYNYALDPTADGVTTPAGALRQAILGASLKAVRHTVKLPSGSARAKTAGVPAGLTGHPARVATAMMAAANRIVGKPYGHDGGHGVWDASNYDCSGAAGYVLHAAGLQSGFGYTGTDVNWGAPGPGKYITRAIRNPYSNGHEMLSFFGHYLESGGGGPLGRSSVHWDSGWDGSFPILRHPPGLRRGGRIPAFRAGGPVRNRFGQPANPNEATARRFRTGGRTTPTLNIKAGGRPALPPLPASLGYTEIGSLQQDLALVPTTAVSIGVRTARGALLSLNRALHTIQTTPNDARIRQAMSALAGTLGDVGKVSYATLQRTHDALAHQVQVLATVPARTIQMWGRTITLESAHPRHMTTGQKHEQQRLQQTLQLVNYQMGQRTGTLVRVAENESAALSSAQTRLQRLMDRKGIDQASAQGASMLEKFDAQSVKVLKDTVAKLQQAYRMAQKAGDKKALADIGQKLTDALDNLDQAVTDQITAHRTTVAAIATEAEAKAQATADQAAHRSTLAQTGEQALQLQQQIAGTYQTTTGAKQLSSYITSTIVPALQNELRTLQAQQAVAASVGDQQTADQIGEAVASKLNDVLQAQLDAQTATKDNTQQIAQNTQANSGQLGVSYQGQSLPDLAGMLNGV